MKCVFVTTLLIKFMGACVVVKVKLQLARSRPYTNLLQSAENWNGFNFILLLVKPFSRDLIPLPMGLYACLHNGLQN